MLLLLVIGSWAALPAWSDPIDVLVVMSYEENNPWCREIKEGIDSVLTGEAELSWFYMDTRIDLAS